MDLQVSYSFFVDFDSDIICQILAINIHIGKVFARGSSFEEFELAVLIAQADRAYLDAWEGVGSHLEEGEEMFSHIYYNPKEADLGLP